MFFLDDANLTRDGPVTVDTVLFKALTDFLADAKSQRWRPMVPSTVLSNLRTTGRVLARLVKVFMGAGHERKIHLNLI